MTRNINARMGSGDAFVLRSEMGRGVFARKVPFAAASCLRNVRRDKKRVRNVLFIIAFAMCAPIIHEAHDRPRE